MYQPAMLLLGIYQKEIKLVHWRDICTPIILVPLQIIDKKEELRYLSSDKKLMHVHNEILTKKNRLQSFATIQMDLKGIIVRKISNAQRGKCYMSSFIWGI